MTPEGTVDIIFCGTVLWGVAHLRLKVDVILKLCDAVVFQTMFSQFFLILSFRFTQERGQLADGHPCNQRRQWHPTPCTLAWKIPWMEEPGGMQSMVS